MATIFAWSGAFKKRGELDNLPELVHFGEALEAASLQTLNEGIMTKVLCGLAEGITPPLWTARALSRPSVSVWKPSWHKTIFNIT